MPAWLTEDAFIPMLVGIFASVVLLLMAYSARNRVVFLVSLLVAGITAGIVATEKLIVTERETVVAIVYELARHARQNDVDQLATFISKEAPQIKTKLYANFSEYEVAACSIVGFTGFESDGQTAKINFTAWASGGERRGHGMKGQVNPKVMLEFSKESEDTWKIINYTIDVPRAGLNL